MKKDHKDFSPRRKHKVFYEDEQGRRYSIEDRPERESHYRRKKTDKNILESTTAITDNEKVLNGIVIEVSRKSMKVLLANADQVVDCIIGGNFNQKYESVIATGDDVQIEKIPPQSYVVRKVYPRRTKLARPAAVGTKLKLFKEKIIAANIDLLGIIVSAKKPDFKPALIDRYLLTAEKNNIRVLIVMNKIDLVETPPEAIQEYEKLGIKVIYTSTITGLGIEELRQTLQNKFSAFTGHSGVGKSSLLNALASNLNLKTSADKSDSVHCWFHTTRKSTLYRLENNTLVIDTPGIRELGVHGIDASQVSWYFPDFHDAAEQCKFNNCTHDHEPGCHVKEMVDQGEISAMRYDNYLRVYYSIKDETL